MAILADSFFETDMPVKFFSLLQLNRSIQKLISGIGQEFWVAAEIANVQIGAHCYLELVQKEEEQIVAKQRAMMWGSQAAEVFARLGLQPADLLQSGRKVLVQVRVTFHEIHGLSLTISDIDPAYTLGELEQARRATLQKLTELGLIHRQNQLVLPAVVQRIAVISSPEAAGYSDFVDQLNGNGYGYRFYLTLFPASVQGERAELEISAQLKAAQQGDFEAIILIRGGGSRLDLEVFDRFGIAQAIAQSTLPVITGIGHLRDESVCDVMAHLPLKTPTAVAEFLIQRALLYESEMQNSFEAIVQLAQDQLYGQHIGLKEISQGLSLGAQGRLAHARTRLALAEANIRSSAGFVVQRAAMRLERLQDRIEALSPENILHRGYSITLKNGQIVRATTELQPGDSLTTLTAHSQIESIIQQITPREP